MKSTTRKGAIIGALFCMTLILLPVLVKADVQQQVTEVAEFSPQETNNNEVTNIANDTSTYNWQTWDPLPPGMFVGGSFKESLMQLNEYPIGLSYPAPSGGGATYVSEMQLVTPVKFSHSYIMSGASSFVVRFPLDVTTYMPVVIKFFMFIAPADPDAYSVVTRNTLYGIPLGAGHNHLDVINSDGTDLQLVCNGGIDLTSTSPSSWTYVRDGRPYENFRAPVHADQWYLLAMNVYYPADSRLSFYLCPGDLASDNHTSSSLSYAYSPASDVNVTKVEHVPADFGWSFVFQDGLGINSVSYDRMISSGTELFWTACIPTGSTPYYNGVLNFVMEFRLNASSSMTWGLDVSALVNVGGSNVTKHVLNSAYWTGQHTTYYVVAANPEKLNYTATLYYAGSYYVELTVILYFQSSQRTMIMLVDDTSRPYTYQDSFQRTNLLVTSSAAMIEEAFFYPWATLTLADNETLNYTHDVILPHGPGFWTGIGHWLQDHWVDILGFSLIVVGVIAAPFTLGGSLALVGIGLTMLLYENWPAFRDFVNKLIKFVLDGLQWLGEWLYKIGLAIWKALTWFVDQLVYYGTYLIGLLIIAASIMIFVLPIYFEMRILAAFLAMAEGDLKAAAAQLSGVVSTAKSLVGR